MDEQRPGEKNAAYLRRRRAEMRAARQLGDRPDALSDLVARFEATRSDLDTVIAGLTSVGEATGEPVLPEPARPQLRLIRGGLQADPHAEDDSAYQAR